MQPLIGVFLGNQDTHHNRQVLVRRKGIYFFLDMTYKYFIGITEFCNVVVEVDRYAVDPEFIQLFLKLLSPGFGITDRIEFDFVEAAAQCTVFS